jgi:hypothetical protein
LDKLTFFELLKSRGRNAEQPYSYHGDGRERGMGYRAAFGSVLAAGLLSGGAACSSGEERAFQGGGSESKPVSKALMAEKAPDPESAGVLGTYSYAITIVTKSGVTFDGAAKIEVLSDLSLRTSDASVQIGSLKIDLSALTQRLSLDFFKDSEHNITREGGIVYVRKYASATFDPPRPLFIGPLVRNLDRFKNLKKTSYHTVTVNDGSSRLTGQGSFSLEVLETNGTFKSSQSQQNLSYSDVLHWQLTSTGFESVPADKVLSFQKVEWWYSTNPLGVVKLAITGDLGNLVKQGEKNQKAVVGEVTITMEIIDMKL